MRRLGGYIAKRDGVPAEGQRSDNFVFDAARWCKKYRLLGEADFVATIRRARPEFTVEWIESRWRSATGTSR